jgi:arginyl-tRNA---protein transferase
MRDLTGAIATHGTGEFREKKRRKQNFDLLTVIHEAEYRNVKRLIDPETKRPIEPAHKFEVTLESDSISQRK